uniref:Annexin n=1 Tax=Chaetoceros debilis TaxID=122233 RepID=A0A7S3VEQ1_9STRA
MSASNEEFVSIDIYPELMFEEDLTPDCGVEIDDVCEQIKTAVKGWGSDEGGLIDALGSTTPEDRLKIAIRYKDIYDKELKDVLKKETSGDFGQAMKYLSLDPVRAECAMIKDACKGIGSHATLLHTILVGRSNRDMELLKKTYYKYYTKDLTGIISSELGGDNWKLASAGLQAAEEPFDPDYHTEEKAEEDAEEIWKNGQGKFFGTDETKLFKTVVLSPPKYLRMINEIYADKYGYTLTKAMEEELGGNARRGAVFAIKMRLKPYEAIAEMVKAACAGIGTDELLLTCCVIRYQDMMGHVNFAHEEMYGKNLQDRVRDECDGDYKKLLLSLLEKVSPES